MQLWLDRAIIYTVWGDYISHKDFKKTSKTT